MVTFAVCAFVGCGLALLVRVATATLEADLFVGAALRRVAGFLTVVALDD